MRRLVVIAGLLIVVAQALTALALVL